MTLEAHREIERKYDVGDADELPALDQVPGVATTTLPEEVDLEAVYFDTEDLRLAAAGVTLRRRTGGDDAGWHLKLPVGRDERRELRLPLGAASDDSVPEELLERVRVLLRERRAAAVVTVRTRRTSRRLLSADGAAMVEVTDDTVSAERLTERAGALRWREWEVELVDGDREVADAVEMVLLTAGARRAALGSKLARALGDRVPTGSAPTEPTKRSTAGEVLLAYLHAQRTELHRQDMRFRAGEESAVHQLRIAARRLRSALASYRRLLEPGSTDRLRSDLRWLGGVLAEARDAQVLRERLTGLVDTQPAELVLGPVRRRIDDELGEAYRVGRGNAAEALSGHRYFQLLDALDALIATPPWAQPAAEPARHELPLRLKAEIKRVRGRARTARSARDHAQQDVAMHDIRKAAKRLRYAAEAAQPAVGKAAKRLAQRAKDAQQLLGEHQDTVVARGVLREIGIRAHLSGENGFTFGRLHALEEARAGELERRYPAVVSRLLAG